MHWLDITIVAASFVGFFAIAIVLAKRAGKNIDSYFLGSRSMGWWMLGASGMASNVDMAGTMLNASLIFLLGFSGFFIEFRGGLVLIMAFFMAFMGKWTRRSGRMTVAEWMEFRFGTGPQGDLPRLLAALGNIFFFVSTIAFFSKGAEKFIAVFLPEGWSPELCSAGLIVIVMIYTTLSGFAGVVWTDVLQGGLILFMSIYIATKAFWAVDFAMVQDMTDANWLALLPPREIAPPKDYETFQFLRFAVTWYFLKTAIDGLSGAGGYISQRFFAARNERECGLLSAFWIFLMAFRWPLIIGVAVLGLTIRDQIDDPEMVLPVVLQELVPYGIRGLVLVGLIGAAMSTYSSVINGGASYFVKDIYQAFIRKDAGERELVITSYVATIAFVAFGLAMAYTIDQINDIWGWLNMGLGFGLILPNFLRWYWWRLNGYGFAAGVAAGMIIAVGQRVCQELWPASCTLADHWVLMLVGAGSLVAMVGVSMLTAPIPRETLENFFRTTRPFGFWGPIRRQLAAAERRGIVKENIADLWALACAVPWQVVLFLLPMLIVIHHWTAAAWAGGILVALTIALYFTWFRRLDPERLAGESTNARTAGE